jgi:hypothetical protein
MTAVELHVENLRSGRSEWARRLWAILSPVIAGVIAAGILYYLGWKK